MRGGGQKAQRIFLTTWRGLWYVSEIFTFKGKDAMTCLPTPTLAERRFGDIDCCGSTMTPEACPGRTGGRPGGEG